MNLRIQPVGEKRVRISGIAPVLAVMLREIPEILELRDAPIAQTRLFPTPTRGNDKINKEWQQMVGPELRHLFVSAGETVTRDLTAVVIDEEDPEAYQIDFPIEHVRAWMSALNEARLILSEVHEINEDDMNRADFDSQSPKHLATVRIHLLGYLLHLFVELEVGDESEDSL